MKGNIFRRKMGILLMLILAGVAFSPAVGQTKAPAKLQAALFMKVLAFYTNLGSSPFTIHVIGAPDVAKELKGFVGKSAGKATLNAVTEGDNVPSDPAQVVYVGGSVDEAIAYTQAQKILSITGIPDFVTKGVTLGIGIENAKPKILLNLSSSKTESINWNPAILKVASTIE